MRGFDAAFVERYRAARASGTAMPTAAPQVLRCGARRSVKGLLSMGEAGDNLTRGNAPVRVVGIDTSLRCTGLAAIEERGGTAVFLDCRPIPNPARRSLPECLVEIADRLVEFLDRWAPDEIAMEGIYFCKNARTALVLGHARGVVVEICARRHLPVHEYAPSRVKRAATGVGSASKAQMQLMMQRFFKLPELPQEDSADALAIALAHLNERRIAAMMA
jgi:crossover junction endodeoxyribonuclease RuvC